jgi:putative tryptophan/tyrosine transport system permease protein
VEAVSSFWISTLEQGLIYGIMVLGVFITYKILDFPDLSVDGSFPLGAAVTAYCLVNGVNPYAALAYATIAGALAGFVTGMLHVKLGISNLLSGILVMTGLYSVNLRVMGRPNIPLFSVETIFSSGTSSLLIVAIAAIAAKLVLDWYLSTKAGFMLKATGDNPQLVTTLGVDIGKIKIIGVMISNGIVALSGSILAQQQTYADVQMGVGIVVMGLASIIVGQSLFKKISFVKMTSAALIGSIIYRTAIAAALRTNLEPTDLRLITAIIVVIFLGVNNKGSAFKKSFSGLFKKERQEMLASEKGGE